ncbi:MAG: methyltransferase domain-containing protein [Candidatus Methanomethylophilaceae archaeon]|nr:methyltransferase domain-containing protein [Candidatus Methanomethylophilaceae archaeon]MDD3378709.1 methyltransferase domain-containing protein [Candidatus Methanomethylophilaceae archaeon]MDY0224179.1 methyltransferase domain-containing protein [Candidatus Methanomethylophilaceae archaeon]
MPFRENEFVYLVDAAGKRVWLKVADTMLKIAALGTVDGSRIMGLDDGDHICIVGRDYTVFRPGTIELMDSLERGAQIITSKDAATILMNCDVKSGDTIIEVGAGSGGLTTALLGVVAPTGSVHTLEFKEENALRALRNVKRTGLDKYWTFIIGDAKNASVDIMADALIMDMPDPWLALDNLIPHLRNGGRVCAYVPNMNQAESIVIALRDRNFAEVYALENLQRGLEVHPGGVRPAFEMLGHTGYLIFGRKRTESKDSV